MRNVNMNFADDSLEAMQNLCTPQEVDKAIAYLSTWAMTSYPFVTISIHGDSELVGVYRRDNTILGRPDYVIGAVFNEDSAKFGFHS